MTPEPGASWKRFFLSLTISNGVWQMPRQSEELQKGYTFHDTVVRHSMVKVAN